MTDKRKILIIENQFTQFVEIVKLLDTAGYQSFPSDEKSFKDYLDWIRIYLNPRYTKDRREYFWNKIFSKTIEYNADIIIVDHILVGTHNAEDGIDLVIKFRENHIKLPIIFFSRTELNNIDVCDKLPKVLPERTWIFKGYSGVDILEEQFFFTEVTPIIELLLKKSICNKVIEKLNEKKIQKIIATTTDIQKEIIVLTNKLVEQINKDEIKLNDEVLNKLSEDKLDSEYLLLLKSMLIK